MSKQTMIIIDWDWASFLNFQKIEFIAVMEIPLKFTKMGHTKIAIDYDQEFK